MVRSSENHNISVISINMVKGKKLRHRVSAKSLFVLANMKEIFLKAVIVSEYVVVLDWRRGKNGY